MKPLAQFLEELSTNIPAGVVDQQANTGLAIKGFSLTLPIETRVPVSGDFWVSLPRGRLATGFDIPHGHIKVSFVRDDFKQGEPE